MTCEFHKEAEYALRAHIAGAKYVSPIHREIKPVEIFGDDKIFWIHAKTKPYGDRLPGEGEHHHHHHHHHDRRGGEGGKEPLPLGPGPEIPPKGPVPHGGGIGLPKEPIPFGPGPEIPPKGPVPRGGIGLPIEPIPLGPGPVIAPGPKEPIPVGPGPEKPYENEKPKERKHEGPGPVEHHHHDDDHHGPPKEPFGPGPERGEKRGGFPGGERRGGDRDLDVAEFLEHEYIKIMSRDERRPGPEKEHYAVKVEKEEYEKGVKVALPARPEATQVFSEHKASIVVKEPIHPETKAPLTKIVSIHRVEKEIFIKSDEGHFSTHLGTGEVKKIEEEEYKKKIVLPLARPLDNC